jgi:hypothetical protein
MVGRKKCETKHTFFVFLVILPEIEKYIYTVIAKTMLRAIRKIGGRVPLKSLNPREGK